MSRVGQSETSRRYIVQRLFVVDFADDGEIGGRRWIDVAVLDADDPGAALHAAVTGNREHHIRSTTYRVAEEALIVNVSINLETVDG